MLLDSFNSPVGRARSAGPSARFGMNVRAAFLAPNLQTYVARYAMSHQNKVNQRLHLIGIPLITIAVLGLLARVRLQTTAIPTLLQPNLALALLASVCGWYLCLSLVAGAWLLFIGSAFYAVGSSLALPWIGGLGLLGVVLNKIGHRRFEGKSPAVLKRPVAVFEAPAWFMARMAGVESLPLCREDVEDVARVYHDSAPASPSR